MTNPYLILGVPTDAGDEQIRKRYLELVRRFSPEQAPARFGEILRAFEQIKTATLRRKYQLFAMTPPGKSPLDTVRQWARHQPLTPPPWPRLLTLLRTAANA